MTVDPGLVITFLILAIMVLAGTLLDTRNALQTYKISYAKLEEALKYEKEMLELYRNSYDDVSHELEQAYSNNKLSEHKES